jgi:hypothetical protein
VYNCNKSFKIGLINFGWVSDKSIIEPMANFPASTSYWITSMHFYSSNGNIPSNFFTSLSSDILDKKKDKVFRAAALTFKYYNKFF